MERLQAPPCRFKARFHAGFVVSVTKILRCCFSCKRKMLGKFVYLREILRT
tara:strand:+ start:923 stop:1075 length:153 start_codon:yes stop_codon:yes gene_type:complete